MSATDVRAATKEQVESLGGKFIMVEDDEVQNAETEGGYAKEMSDDYKKKQAQLIADTDFKARHCNLYCSYPWEKSTGINYRRNGFS